MIDAPDLCPIGGESISIELTLGVEHDGEIVWSRGGYVGIKFSSRVHPAVVRHLGYKEPPPLFVETQPFDRFGRPLPELGTRL